MLRAYPTRSMSCRTCSDHVRCLPLPRDGKKTMNKGPRQRGNVVVVLGAGFSRAIYGLCPLTDDLGNEVRARLGPSDRAKLPRRKFIDGRFEEWLSYLSEPQPHLTPEESADANALALRVIRLISEVLSQVQAQALVAGTGEWFWQFLSVLH